MVVGSGTNFLECFHSCLSDPYRKDLLMLTQRNLEWLEAGAKGRRSINNLAQTRAERDVFTKTGNADPAEIEKAALRAQREMSDQPLRMRIGVTEVGKQALQTDDLWHPEDLPRQRGAKRSRDTRLMMGTSKHIGQPTLPGPTSAIPRKEHPDRALARIAAAIREADPEAQFIDVDFDQFDECVCTARGEDRRPFALRVPNILSSYGVPSGPTALYLRPTPAIDNTPVDQNLRDVKALRVGLRGKWSDEYTGQVEGADPLTGVVVAQTVHVRITEPMKIGLPPYAFRARVARVAADRGDARFSPDARLVAVIGEEDEEAIVSLVLASLSFNDEHPLVADFVAARDYARVFRGEQQERNPLHVDRGIAGVAFAAYLLDQNKPIPAVAVR